ncbi:lipopolysaccharide biosynthesis protein [Dorea sp. D27]|uniref:lipopolysaccharide biosynthesis protein n=1 Tax=Dorea sp. D27 TaxID=658665 RepID=UPI0006730AE3|nr:hypothetical protein [Dorea sp. D27]KMZ55357.1 hypothetical protein HMPREF0980_00705 [Dorea sp. D27]
MQPDSSRRLLQWNIIVSMMSQIASLIINLISKRVICIYLDLEYLGLQSLYSNFCDVLSFAFFGAGTAMLFSFYGPMAKGDKEQLAATYRYYDNIYRKLTWIFSGIGVLTTLPAVFSVNASISDSEVAVTFVTFMLSIVLYNRHMVRNYYIQADQRRYFVAAVTGMVDALALAAEILVLKLLKSYEAFVICILLKNLFTNYIFGCYLKSRYSYLFTRVPQLEKAEKDSIKANVTDMVMYRFGKVLISNTDNIFISRFINTAMVGIYSNYQFIIAGITSLVSAFYEAVTARIGQMLSVKDKEDQYAEFRFYSFLNSWMAGASIVCFFYLVQDFLKIWMGAVARLDQKIIIIIIVNYYLETCRFATKMYRESAGLFRNIKRMILIKGILNIVLSFFMGKFWGLEGILLATAVSSAVTLFWYEPLVVYRYFKKSFVNELYYQAAAVIQMACSFVTAGLAAGHLSGNGPAGFLLKAAVCGVSANVCYVLSYLYVKKKL